MSVVLRVDRTWDGAPVASSEVAELTVGWQGGEMPGLHIAVDAPFHADPPPPGPPGPTDGLWQFEVVELFMVGAASSDGCPRYTELELSPHGHHLVLEFHGVRQVVRQALPLSFTARIDGSRWQGQALLGRSFLPSLPYRANAYAIHGTGLTRRYLAMTAVVAPDEKGGVPTLPDFHRPDLFSPVVLA